MSDMAPAAYLLHGGRLFQDRASTHLVHAEKDLKNRNDGSKIEPLFRQSEVDTRIAELTAEVASLRGALQTIADNPASRTGPDFTWTHWSDIARNALKDGV